MVCPGASMAPEKWDRTIRLKYEWSLCEGADGARPHGRDVIGVGSENVRDRWRAGFWLRYISDNMETGGCIWIEMFSSDISLGDSANSDRYAKILSINSG